MWKVQLFFESGIRRPSTNNNIRHYTEIHAVSKLIVPYADWWRRVDIHWFPHTSRNYINGCTSHTIIIPQEKMNELTTPVLETAYQNGQSLNWRIYRNCRNRDKVWKNDENKNVKHCVIVKIYVRTDNCSLSRRT